MSEKLVREMAHALHDIGKPCVEEALVQRAFLQAWEYGKVEGMTEGAELLMRAGMLDAAKFMLGASSSAAQRAKDKCSA